MFLYTVKRDSMSASPIPNSFALTKDDDAAQVKTQAQEGNSEQVFAADYDPSLDRREDERKIVMGNGNHPVDDVEMIEEVVEEDEEEDLDDMFAVDKPEKKKVKKVKKVVVSNRTPAPAFVR